MAKPEVRRQTQWVPLTKEQFRARFFARYYDPVFDAVRAEGLREGVGWLHRLPQVTPQAASRNGVCRPELPAAH
jgi:hypothetical protein